MTYHWVQWYCDQFRVVLEIKNKESEEAQTNGTVSTTRSFAIWWSPAFTEWKLLQWTRGTLRVGVCEGHSSNHLLCLQGPGKKQAIRRSHSATAWRVHQAPWKETVQPPRRNQDQDFKYTWDGLLPSFQELHKSVCRWCERGEANRSRWRSEKSQ